MKEGQIHWKQYPEGKTDGELALPNCVDTKEFGQTPEENRCSHCNKKYKESKQ